MLPVPVPKLFTYRVPLEMNPFVEKGKRAIVPFGDRKIVTGVIVNVHETPPKDYEAKYILELLDEYPCVLESQMNLFNWMAEYYCCTVGEVMNAALPAGLKLSSESYVQLNPEFNLEETEHFFSEKEYLLLHQLKAKEMTYTEISKLLGVRNIHAILKSLGRKEAILIIEEIKEKYKPKVQKRIRLTEEFITPDALEALFQQLGSKPKQEEVLLRFLQHVPVLQQPGSNKRGMSKKEILVEDISESSLQTLIKNGILEEFEVVVPRFSEIEAEPVPVRLSEDQQRAQQEILASFSNHPVTLFHGITGSGKTEIYIDLIQKALAGGNQVLYLLPEIALTTQIVQRLFKIFGSAMGIYHSRFSDNERVEVWKGITNGKIKFVVGVRSSVFLPFDNLGLIIVDEEHDGSYKQQEPAPRYHARDVAVMMGHIHHAKVLLGSATPSIESYYNAVGKKYGLVQLHQRFGSATLPDILIADLRKERRNKTVKGEFSSLLLKQIQDTLAAGEQAIIFQNRRGFSPMMTCEDCGWVPKCVNCAVSLTYHQYRHALVCHYCGYKEQPPNQCPTCTSRRIHTVGYGTEKLEQELSLHFPEAVVDRMDLDTTRSKTGYETIIEHFEKGQTNILVGTQMVTKGLDFDRVNLVGVFNADRMMHFPDFRAHERAYQLITQVSGRAGRREKKGVVVIQTSSADHPLLAYVIQNDYHKFYQSEISDRYQHHYPPFTRLVELTIKHVDKKVSQQASWQLHELLKNQLHDVRFVGPGEPAVSKIRNQFLMTLLIKIPRGTGNLAKYKYHITQCVHELQAMKDYRSVRVVIDVDPN